ncbi:MAG: POT family MFS transporter [Planctomycetota bacterium]|nr:POT family MFS transporter [Planctomycetota bacterium]
MARSKYRTAPLASKKLPTGLPFIVGNEAAERLSYYGMKALLPIFLTSYLMTAAGDGDQMTRTEMISLVSLFGAGVYVFPILGAIIADAVLGKYLTIMSLSIVYVAGHACLALMDMPQAALEATMEPRSWLYLGLLLIAIGSGGIKPCVTAHVGDQFGKTNAHLLERVYAWFYFSINFGSFFAYALLPGVMRSLGPGWAFGIPGIAMAVATLVFWLGRRRYAHVQPKGMQFVRESFTGEGLSALVRLLPIYVFVAIFWSLYDQSATTWVDQSRSMDRNVMGLHLLPDSIGMVNPLLIMIFIPIFAYLIYPGIEKVWKLTAIRKIGLGFVLTAIAFGVSALAEHRITDAREAFVAQVSEVHAEGKADLANTATLMREGKVTVGDTTHTIPDKRPELAKVIEEFLQEGQQADLPVMDIANCGVLLSTDGVTHEAKWPSVWWTLVAYIILTAGEVMVSITCLEFSYTQAPRAMKSFVMGLYFLSVSLGNVITWGVNQFTMDAEGNSSLVGATYYWFFTGLMVVAGVVYACISPFFKPRTYMQEEQADGATS